MLTDFNNFINIAAEKICKQMTYSFLIISSLCIAYRLSIGTDLDDLE